MPQSRHVASLAALTLTLAALASQIAPSHAADSTRTVPPPPCSAPAYRQFDFWLGRWDVSSPQGQVQGTNEITRALGQCALRERWVGAKGGVGESLNAYDASRRVWHQTWIDAQGTLLTLEGGLREGSMVLEGVQPGADGKPVRQRITWIPKSADEVHQVWDSSTDDGRTWTTAFHGVYRRAKG